MVKNWKGSLYNNMKDLKYEGEFMNGKKMEKEKNMKVLEI